MQKLKIIPKDQVHIDLTDSPPPSPKVKREKRTQFIKHEARESRRVERSVKQVPVCQLPTANAHVRAEGGVTAETADDTRTSGE